MKNQVMILLMAVIAGCGQEPGSWRVVKQRDRPNFGYRDDSGFIFAGYTNREEALAAMNFDREQRQKVYPPQKTKQPGLWEEVP